MAFLLEFDADQATRCPGCGGYLDETTAVGRDDDFDAELIACHRCAAGDQAVEAFRKAHGVEHGLRVRTFELPPDPDEEDGH